MTWKDWWEVLKAYGMVCLGMAVCALIGWLGSFTD